VQTAIQAFLHVTSRQIPASEASRLAIVCDSTHDTTTVVATTGTADAVGAVAAGAAIATATGIAVGIAACAVGTAIWAGAGWTTTMLLLSATAASGTTRSRFQQAREAGCVAAEGC